jgi:3-oxoacyl-[acyl-carrier-protein] synthase-3
MSVPAYANIVSSGSYLPEVEITNDDLRARFAEIAPEFVNKMEKASGILKRWQAPDGWAASDLALQAAKQALTRAGKSPEDVDLIILGTDSPDYITPATSVVLQSKLGAINAGTFDVGCACASFPTALSAAAGLMTSNPSLRTVLVVAVYLMRKLARDDDPFVFFYGDGAGAVVLERSDAPGYIASAFAADGSYHRNWLIESGGTVEPATAESVQAGRTSVRMVERYPPEINDAGWPKLVRRLAENGGFALTDVDMIIFSQVRKPTIEIVMNDLGLPMTNTHTIMEHAGYTGSACIPMALDDAVRGGRIKPGDLVVLVGSGVGYNQAAVALRMPLDEGRLFA